MLKVICKVHNARRCIKYNFLCHVMYVPDIDFLYFCLFWVHISFWRAFSLYT